MYLTHVNIKVTQADAPIPNNLPRDTFQTATSEFPIDSRAAIFFFRLVSAADHTIIQAFKELDGNDMQLLKDRLHPWVIFT